MATPRSLLPAPSPMSSPIRYLVFDIESVADAPLVAKLRFPGESLAPAEAFRRYRAELMEKFESDFIPYTFQVPISVAVGKVATDFRLADVVVLDEPQFRPHVITGELLARLGKVPSADAGQLQRPRVRPAALGIDRVPLRPEPAKLVSIDAVNLRSNRGIATTLRPTSTSASCLPTSAARGFKAA